MAGHALSGTVKVDPQKLKDFANTVLAVLGESGAGSVSDARAKLDDVANSNMLLAGRDLVPEAKDLVGIIKSTVQAAESNLNDFTNGLTTVCNDLKKFADRFADADALAKASAEDIFNALGPDIQASFKGATVTPPQQSGLPALGGL